MTIHFAAADGATFRVTVKPTLPTEHSLSAEDA
jgi:hypothetical protein